MQATEGFRPDVFFGGEWRGWGVSRDIFGQIRDRYSVEGVGIVDDERRLFSLKERYTFSGGRVDLMEWDIVTDEQGAFSGGSADGVLGEGRQRNGHYEWRFRRRVPTTLGVLPVDFKVIYAAVSADRAISITKLACWGLPLATLTTAYCRT